MKILLGIPASQGAGDGYQPADKIKTIVDSIRDDDNFAGKISDYNSSRILLPISLPLKVL